MSKKNTKSPARSIKLKISKNYLRQFDEDYWQDPTDSEKRDSKNKQQMAVSGKSVFTIKKIMQHKKD